MRKKPSTFSKLCRQIRDALLACLRVLMLISLVALGAAGYIVGRGLYEQWALAAARAALPPGAGQRIGVIAGHWQNDSGAVCPDGLQEVQITTAVAQRVVEALQERGYRAEMLPEFSPRLAGYQAEALVSIHVDSCLKGRSGFKVARVVGSAVPEAEDRLVESLYLEYEKASNLKRDLNTITADMTSYHAFNEIAPQTPGAIIEIGFLGGDRRLLTRDQGKAALGVAAGIARFLQGETP
jgi:N-acetylmuramoyl-L-alanine amidase